LPIFNRLQSFDSILAKRLEKKTERQLLLLSHSNIFKGHILAGTLCSLWELFEIAGEEKNIPDLNLTKVLDRVKIISHISRLHCLIVS